MKTIVAVVLSLALAGCSTLTGMSNQPPLISGQHPAFALNSADCALIGVGIATLATVAPVAIIASGLITKGFCDAEGSIVAGPPAVITTVSTTSSTVQAPAK